MKKLWILMIYVIVLSCQDPVQEPDPINNPPPSTKTEYSVLIEGSNVTIIPSRSFKVEKDSAMNVQAVANDGYVLDSLYVNDMKMSLASAKSYNYSVGSVKNNYKIKVVTKPALKEYTIEVVGDNITVTPAVKSKISEGSDITLGITVISGRVFESATVNGISIPVSGTVLNYSISDINKDYLLNVVTKPAPIIPTRDDTLQSRMWHLDALDVLIDNVWKTHMDVTSDEKGKTHSFLADGKMKTYRVDGTYWGFNEWSWVGPYGFKIGSQLYPTYKLTDTRFELFQPAEGTIYRIVYVRLKASQ